MSMLWHHESGDEFHYVFGYPFYRKEKNIYLDRKEIVIRPCTLHMLNLFLYSDIEHSELLLFLRIIVLYFADLYKSEQSCHMSLIKMNVTPRSGRSMKQATILYL